MIAEYFLQHGNRFCVYPTGDYVPAELNLQRLTFATNLTDDCKHLSVLL